MWRPAAILRSQFERPEIAEASPSLEVMQISHRRRLEFRVRRADVDDH
jgi:hypothetical protein